MSTTSKVKAKAETTDVDALSTLIALSANPTAETVATMETMVETADDGLRLATFHGRVTTSAMVGYTLKAKATVALGEVDGFAKAAETVGVTQKSSATYLGRKFSTLEECWRIASHHTAERLEAFVSTYREAHGVNPESVRAYSVWVNADAKGGKRAAANTVETLKARKASAAKAKASAETAAKAKADRRVALIKAKASAKATDRPIPLCPITRAQWEGMTVETLDQVEIMAAAIKAAKVKAARKAETAETDSTASAETGPKAKAKARTKVTA